MRQRQVERTSFVRRPSQRIEFRSRSQAQLFSSPPGRYAGGKDMHSQEDAALRARIEQPGQMTTWIRASSHGVYRQVKRMDKGGIALQVHGRATIPSSSSAIEDPHQGAQVGARAEPILP